MAEPEAKNGIKYAPPSPKGGALLPLGKHPWQTGGKKGRSGRKSKDFLTRCLEATEDSDLWQAARKKQPYSVLDMAAGYTHGKPKSTTELTGEVTVRVVRVPRK